jgi:ribosome-associated toxin RatA of RatAB toxin-antitoxin module
MEATTHSFEFLPSREARPIYSGKADIWIAATPEQVYDLVSDMPRMGEFSPECYRTEWLDGATGPATGARARGWNKYLGMRWARDVCVLVAARGSEFTFQTIPQKPFYQDSTVWRYTFAPEDGGTRVTESYAIVLISPWINLFEKITGRPDQVPLAMQQTLARIKRTIENDTKATR